MFDIVLFGSPFILMALNCNVSHYLMNEIDKMWDLPTANKHDELLKLYQEYLRYPNFEGRKGNIINFIRQKGIIRHIEAISDIDNTSINNDEESLLDRECNISNEG